MRIICTFPPQKLVFMKKNYFLSFHRIVVMLMVVVFTTATGVSASPCVPPHQYSVTGGGSFCSGGSGVYVGINYTDVGVSYQLLLGGSPVGTPLTGSGAPRSFGLQTAPGVYTVRATNTTTSCTSIMLSSATVTLNSVATITGPSSVCVGQTVTLNSSISGGTWTTIATTQVSVGATTGVVTGLSPSTPAIRYTLSSGCVSTVTMTVNALEPTGPVGNQIVCKGQTITLINNTAGGGTWSSGNASIATVNYNSGVTEGLTAGATVITFTSSKGCMTTKSVTVNPREAITGDSTVCMGQSITLSNSITGGTWSTFAHTQATVDLHTGVVTGVISSSPAIMYTTPTGCVSILTVTVNPLFPIGPVGTQYVCQGQTTIFTNNTTPGSGTWSCANTSVATIATVSGVITGITAGTTVISFTTPLGCITTKSVTVNQRANITGDSSVCEGQNVTLSDSVSGGTWSTFATNQASVGLHTGIVTGLATSTPTIRYMAPNGCISTFVIAVNPLSSIGPRGDPLNVCRNEPITLYDNTLGGTWSSANTSVATVNQTTGVTTGVAAGSVVISYTTALGCMTTKTLTVNSNAPIKGDTSVCMGQTITLSDSLTGGVWSTFATNYISVGLHTGIVTGIETSTSTIRYTLPTGCVSTVVITVKPLYNTMPVGVPNICKNGMLQLGNGTPGGGTWSSTTVTVATIDSVTGIAHGLALGTDVITFTSSQGCITTKTVTVINCNTTTGVSQTEAGIDNVTLFPNPNNGTFTLKGSVANVNGAGGDPEISIEIMNMLGQVVYKRNFQTRYGDIEEQVQLDDTIVNSMYLVTVRSGTSQKVFHIVVKK